MKSGQFPPLYPSDSSSINNNIFGRSPRPAQRGDVGGRQRSLFAQRTGKQRTSLRRCGKIEIVPCGVLARANRHNILSSSFLQQPRLSSNRWWSDWPTVCFLPRRSSLGESGPDTDRLAWAMGEVVQRVGQFFFFVLSTKPFSLLLHAHLVSLG